jgi:hypothetical protein
LLAITVLCIFLAVPAAAWAIGVVTGYVAISIVAVGVLVCIQAPVFLLFQAMGWLPSRDPHGAEAHGRTRATPAREQASSDGERTSN